MQIFFDFWKILISMIKEFLYLVSASDVQHLPDVGHLYPPAASLRRAKRGSNLQIFVDFKRLLRSARNDIYFSK